VKERSRGAPGGAGPPPSRGRRSRRRAGRRAPARPDPVTTEESSPQMVWRWPFPDHQGGRTERGLLLTCNRSFTTPARSHARARSSSASVSSRFGWGMSRLVGRDGPTALAIARPSLEDVRHDRCRRHARLNSSRFRRHTARRAGASVADACDHDVQVFRISRDDLLVGGHRRVCLRTTSSRRRRTRTLNLADLGEKPSELNFVFSISPTRLPSSDAGRSTNARALRREPPRWAQERRISQTLRASLRKLIHRGGRDASPRVRRPAASLEASASG